MDSVIYEEFAEQTDSVTKGFTHYWSLCQKGLCNKKLKVTFSEVHDLRNIFFHKIPFKHNFDFIKVSFKKVKVLFLNSILGFTFHTCSFGCPMWGPHRRLSQPHPGSSSNPHQVDTVWFQALQKVLVCGPRELQNLDGILSTQAEGQAVEDHLTPSVLGWDRQPGDEDISGTSTCQTDFRRPQRN